MLILAVRKMWQMLPHWIRLRLTRLTQKKFTVSAAAIIFNDAGEVLVLNHLLRPFSFWGLPGGFVNFNEQPDEAIRRELREEISVELVDLKLYRIRTVESHIEALYTAAALGEPEIGSLEILDWGWFAPTSLPEQMSEAQKRTIKNIVNGIA